MFKCECCGIIEECILGYVVWMKVMFCGCFVCGFCGEVVKEERMCMGFEILMESVFCVYMKICFKFNIFMR